MEFSEGGGHDRRNGHDDTHFRVAEAPLLGCRSALAVMLREPAFGFDGGLTTHAGGRDRLAENMI